ncbi:MAG: C-GCAxxG-C-C family protein [Chitinispirillales bacterium]|nr:C-GCAxxG-C-C family protein [Chitinispirillales bacterium]
MHAENAVKNFISGANCCQAIMSAYAQEYDLDLKTSQKLAAGFGGGIGLSRNVCGAVNAIVMVLGLKFFDTVDKFELYKIIQNALAEFEKRAGSINCARLTNSTYGERLPPQHKQTCSKYIKLACDICDEFIGGDNFDGGDTGE